MNEASVIESLLSEYKDELRSLDEQKQELACKITALEEALSRLGKKAKTRNASSKSNTTSHKPRGRRLDQKWVQVLRFIGLNQSVSLDDITRYIQQNGLPITRSNLRVQLNSYMQKDWVRRVANSTYEITTAGIAKCDLPEKSKPPVADATRGLQISEEDDPTRITTFSDRNLISQKERRTYN